MKKELKKLKKSDLVEILFEILNEDLDKYQLEEIRMGFNNGVDVSKFATSKYDYCQMFQIREGLESGVDITPYLTRSP